MCEKNTITPKGKKLYLATFEFVSGEFEQIFHKAFYARDEDQLEKIIHKFLVGYYGKDNTSQVIDKDAYFYFNDEVAIKNCGWREIAKYEELVDQLL